MRKFTKRSAAVITAAVVAVGGAGAAWAAWSLTGAGSATAKAATVLPLKANSVDVDGQLSPGVASNVQFNLVNENKFPAKLTKVSITNIASSSDTCAATNVVAQDFALPAETTVGPVGTTTATRSITLPNAIKMISTAGDGCKGASFTVSLSLDGITASA